MKRAGRGRQSLTEKQRRFCEAFAEDPENASAAARKAGAGSTAAVTASKWLRLAKVQARIAELRGAAIGRAERKSKRTLDRALDLLWQAAESEAPAKFVRRRNERGKVETVIEEYRPLDATSKLLDWYKPTQRTIAVEVNWELVKQLASEPRGKLVDAWGAALVAGSSAIPSERTNPD